MPTIDPMIEMPFSTVSKIEMLIRCFGGERDADEPAAAAERRERLLEDLGGEAASTTRDVRAAELLDRVDRVDLGRVHHVLGTELRGELQLGLLHVDGDDGSAHDARVLHGEVPETADAEDRDPLGWA